jgi:hypothetical protein
MTNGYTSFKARAERLCSRLNEGLTAVAIVLAMLVFVVGTYRTLETLELSAQPDWGSGADLAHPS